MNRICCIILALAFSSVLAAQDTLPKFSVKNVGNNRFIVGWVNTYGLVKQISIQRSHDSLNNYKTIMSVADPNARQNGFADTKAPNDHMFYRLFVVLDKGQFFFTEAKKPTLDTMRISRTNGIDSRPKDSSGNIIKPIVPKKPDFIPSFFVYTNRDGYVFINLPDADKKKYRIKFFEEDDSFLFEIKSIKETALTLDKTNFMHAGWFKFELYNDEALVEKNKFYLSKEF
ncbi:MAG TPA: hypothetical protein VFR58_00790 [Flavisolibacter sp.]|nr:hypothetical protein [Flavisolibacter sp.]